jgi:hypothetical protein
MNACASGPVGRTSSTSSFVTTRVARPLISVTRPMFAGFWSNWIQPPTWNRRGPDGRDEAQDATPGEERVKRRGFGKGPLEKGEELVTGQPCDAILQADAARRRRFEREEHEHRGRDQEGTLPEEADAVPQPVRGFRGVAVHVGDVREPTPALRANTRSIAALG